MPTVNIVWHHLLRSSLTEAHPKLAHRYESNKHYFSHLSRSLLILDLFMLGPVLVTINWVNNEQSNMRIDIVVPPWRDTISSNDIIIARRYQSKSMHPNVRECKSMGHDWLWCLVVWYETTIDSEFVSGTPICAWLSLFDDMLISFPRKQTAPVVNTAHRWRAPQWKLVGDDVS